jgi:putative intracellular protease/amidase
MQIAILLFDQFTALDAVGPYQVLSRLPGADVVFAAQQPGAIADDLDHLGVHGLARPGRGRVAGRPPRDVL